MNKFINIKNDFLKEYIDIIDVQNDINTFINSKIIKFNIPKEIKAYYYSPQIILKNRNDPVESKITEKVINELTDFFSQNSAKKEKDEDKEFIYIKKCIKLILQEKKYDKDKLMKLLENSKYRIKFLENLNQYRIEGIFELKQRTFDDLCFLFNYIIKHETIDEDYESFKSVIILSQTFYLSSNEKLFLNSYINEIKIFRDKIFWEKIIDYSIKEALNNSKDFYIYLDEDIKNRKQRIDSAITSNIITFIFNMKLFNYPEDKYKELIDDLIKKYNIDGVSIYATVDSINNAIEIEKNINNNKA